MIFNIFRRRTAPEPVAAMYRAIVAQSRQPRFYADWGVPDTVTGRFDMISLHLILLFRRLRSDDPQTRDFSQAVFDLFFKDMDRSLRELGAGDLGVPKRIQKMGSVFYGLLAAVSGAVDRGEHAELTEVLRRNIFAGETGRFADTLADYLFGEVRRLEAVPTGAILEGHLTEGAEA